MKSRSPWITVKSELNFSLINNIKQQVINSIDAKKTAFPCVSLKETENTYGVYFTDASNEKITRLQPHLTFPKNSTAHHWTITVIDPIINKDVNRKLRVKMLWVNDSVVLCRARLAEKPFTSISDYLAWNGVGDAYEQALIDFHMLTPFIQEALNRAMQSIAPLMLVKRNRGAIPPAQTFFLEKRHTPDRPNFAPSVPQALPAPTLPNLKSEKVPLKANKHNSRSQKQNDDALLEQLIAEQERVAPMKNQLSLVSKQLNLSESRKLISTKFVTQIEFLIAGTSNENLLDLVDQYDSIEVNGRDLEFEKTILCVLLNNCQKMKAITGLIEGAGIPLRAILYVIPENEAANHLNGLATINRLLQVNFADLSQFCLRNKRVGEPMRLRFEEIAVECLNARNFIAEYVGKITQSTVGNVFHQMSKPIIDIACLNVEVTESLYQFKSNEISDDVFLDKLSSQFSHIERIMEVKKALSSDADDSRPFLLATYITLASQLIYDCLTTNTVGAFRGDGYLLQQQDAAETSSQIMCLIDRLNKAQSSFIKYPELPPLEKQSPAFNDLFIDLKRNRDDKNQGAMIALKNQIKIAQRLPIHELNQLITKKERQFLYEYIDVSYAKMEMSKSNMPQCIAWFDEAKKTMEKKDGHNLASMQQ